MVYTPYFALWPMESNRSSPDHSTADFKLLIFPARHSGSSPNTIKRMGAKSSFDGGSTYEGKLLVDQGA